MQKFVDRTVDMPQLDGAADRPQRGTMQHIKPPNATKSKQSTKKPSRVKREDPPDDLDEPRRSRFDDATSITSTSKESQVLVKDSQPRYQGADFNDDDAYSQAPTANSGQINMQQLAEEQRRSQQFWTDNYDASRGGIFDQQSQSYPETTDGDITYEPQQAMQPTSPQQVLLQNQQRPPSRQANRTTRRVQPPTSDTSSVGGFHPQPQPQPAMPPPSLYARQAMQAMPPPMNHVSMAANVNTVLGTQPSLTPSHRNRKTIGPQAQPGVHFAQPVQSTVAAPQLNHMPYIATQPVPAQASVQQPSHRGARAAQPVQMPVENQRVRAAQSVAGAAATHQPQALIATTHEPDDLDYPLDELQRKDYKQLEDESFDFNPRPLIVKGLSLDDKQSLDQQIFGMLGQEPHIQAHLFTQMSREQWDEAGTLITQKLIELMQKMQVARQEKREAAKQFEELIHKRHDFVESRKRMLDDAMAEMKAGGLQLMQRTPKKQKVAKN